MPVLFCLPGYSVAAGEFSGDDEEGEGHIYSTGNHCAWLGSEFGDPCTPLSIIHPLFSHSVTDVD